MHRQAAAPLRINSSNKADVIQSRRFGNHEVPLATTLGCGYLDNTFANVGSVSKQMGLSSPDQIGVANGGQMYGAKHGCRSNS